MNAARSLPINLAAVATTTSRRSCAVLEGRCESKIVCGVGPYHDHQACMACAVPVLIRNGRVKSMWSEGLRLGANAAHRPATEKQKVTTT